MTMLRAHLLEREIQAQHDAASETRRLRFRAGLLAPALPRAVPVFSSVSGTESLPAVERGRWGSHRVALRPFEALIVRFERE